ncbi:hypothetical protein VNO77_23923 [Canavalia gladiata]|uniref:Uncharacterized protein n=1 Tax=Canavalia gladiata TaxID=3824 RepID=A0AAN9L645_CANGL
MMGRFISNWNNTLLRHAKGHRHRSTKSHGIEINDFKLLEEHVHRITVKKATPDWLPFLPGSSFWVPPPPSPFLRKLTISSSQGPFPLLHLNLTILYSFINIYAMLLCMIQSHTSNLGPNQGCRLVCNSTFSLFHKTYHSLKTKKDDHHGNTHWL